MIILFLITWWIQPWYLLSLKPSAGNIHHCCIMLADNGIINQGFEASISFTQSPVPMQWRLITHTGCSELLVTVTYQGCGTTFCPATINSLRPSDACMRWYKYQHWFRWWLVAWSAPSHYLNQWWNIVNCTLRNKLQWNFNWNSNIFIQEYALEYVVCEMASILSRPQCVYHITDGTELCSLTLWKLI